MQAAHAQRELIDGSTAIVRAALAAGCDFFAGYPITPASGILAQMLRELPARGGVAVQAEDEIASLSMCIGAVMAGARALTASSGPGLSLYSENVGLAIMGEVPLVIVDVQRMGPATGGATTVGQGDVQFVRWGTSGGYPIIALAPSSVAECFTLTMRAFDLAERFRTPVFLLADKELALTVNTVEPADLVPAPVRARRDAAPARTGTPYVPADAVSPLPRIGGERLVRFTGSSHDERGLLTKDPAVVGALNAHLNAKIASHGDEIESVQPDLQPGARTLVVSYGVTAGAVRQAVRAWRREGRKASCLVVQSLWPVPEAAIERALAGIQRVVVAELNLGEYRREIERLACGRMEVRGLNRVDGGLITPAQVMEALR